MRLSGHDEIHAAVQPAVYGKITGERRDRIIYLIGHKDPQRKVSRPNHFLRDFAAEGTVSALVVGDKRFVRKNKRLLIGCRNIHKKAFPGRVGTHFFFIQSQPAVRILIPVPGVRQADGF